MSKTMFGEVVDEAMLARQNLRPRRVHGQWCQILNAMRIAATPEVSVLTPDGFVELPAGAWPAAGGRKGDA